MIPNLNEIYAYACFIRNEFILLICQFTPSMHIQPLSSLKTSELYGKNQTNTSVNTFKLMVLKIFITLYPPKYLWSKVTMEPNG